ncbi:related to Probable exopolygalacturonase B [Rhynchosporium secalis]|uniref:galacturonan 1,4-alpha-galacturonidase n=1 Tax=Rhynchosporium secalis TaxID=38038 RepID=A0A1E1MU88_RHYSE|nr:related to Probable exopolygalacturonase B [Rhynchosporium secalis]
MLFSLSNARLLALVASLASSVASAATGPVYNGPKSIKEFRSQYPYVKPQNLLRKEFQIRASRSDTDDISAEFLEGLRKANHGGTLVLPKNKTFVIGKKLDLTFLDDVQVNLEGKILFTNNITYWQSNYFSHPFQKSISFWKWGGKNIKIYGSGILDGNGQAWYDGSAGHPVLNDDNTYFRPILFYAENAHNLYIQGIQFQAAPLWTNFVVNSTNVVYEKVVIENLSTSKNPAKNTDGWDTYNVNGITVRDAWVDAGDDCFSPKPNTTNILVENIYCTGTHGISMGSLGQYAGVKDFISNAHIENVVMLDAQNGARLKVWAGPTAGYGYIKNVTFQNFYNYNVDWPIVLDACYFKIDAATCSKYPSRVDMVDIHFKNFTGISSGKNGHSVAKLICSPNAVCTGITVDGIHLTSPSGGAPVVICDGIKGGIGVDCVPSGSA